MLTFLIHSHFSNISLDAITEKLWTQIRLHGTSLPLVYLVRPPLLSMPLPSVSLSHPTEPEPREANKSQAPKTGGHGLYRKSLAFTFPEHILPGSKTTRPHTFLKDECDVGGQ